MKGVYNPDGMKGLMQEVGTGRRNAIEKMLGAIGGKIEAFYYAFGDADVYVIVELPDEISAAAVGLKVNASGLVRISMTGLISPDDIDAATKQSINYRAPGSK